MNTRLQSALGVFLLLAGVGLAAVTSKINPRTLGEWQFSEALSRMRTPALNGLARFIEFVDGPKFIPWLLVGLVIAGFVLKRWVLFTTMVVMTGLAWFPGHIAKKTFPRERPTDVDAFITYQDQMSFPSGHMGMATALTVALLWALHRVGWFKPWMAAAGAVNIIVIGLSRIYAGAHYYLDVVGGFLFAMGTVLLVMPLATMIHRKYGTDSPTDPPQEARPGS